MDSTRNPDALWYADTDQDGYGNPLMTVDSCSDVSQATANDLDCDDNDMMRNPSSQEVCDFIDNDCDGLIDNEDTSLDDYGEVAIYTDADGDGYGIDEYITHACPSSPGSPVIGDCDDANLHINPGAFELPDTTDDNCDNEVFSRHSIRSSRLCLRDRTIQQCTDACDGS